MNVTQLRNQLVTPLREHVHRTQGAYLAICLRLDRYVSRQEFRKRLFGYKLDPQRPCKPRARTHREVWKVDKLANETKIQADNLQNKLIMVRKARDEAKRAASAVLQNLEMLNEAVKQCRLGVKEANKASQLFENCRTQERILFHQASPRSQDARRQKHGPEVTLMPSKKTSKRRKPTAEPKEGKKEPLSSREMEDLIVSLYDGSISKDEEGGAQKREIRQQLRAADHEWRETYVDLITKTREQLKKETGEAPSDSKSKSKKKTSKKKTAKKKS